MHLGILQRNTYDIQINYEGTWLASTKRMTPWHADRERETS